MSKPTVMLHVADTGPLESIAYMFRSCGYHCVLPDKSIKDRLRRANCRNILDIDSLVSNWGYSRPDPLPFATHEDIVKGNIDIFVDTKAHLNYEKIVNVWPQLENKLLWYRINGGDPSTSSDTRQTNPPCPVLTPNQWYHGISKSYACWPTFVKFNGYYDNFGRTDDYHEPMCLIHKVKNWGYGVLVDPIRSIGVRMFGQGSPDGLIQHGQVAGMLSKTIAYVHLKSNDAPGYALYEALSAACPIICTRRLIWRCNMQSLLIPGKTCLTFDRESTDPLSENEIIDCVDEVEYHLSTLKDSRINRFIGYNGYQQLAKVMWNKETDVDSLKDFLVKHFGVRHG